MEDLSNVKNKLLAERAEEQLLRYIQKEPVAVGEKLPNEFKLGEMLGVGRSTVREAVKSLVIKGVLEIRRGSGTYVVSTAAGRDDPLGVRNATDKLALALELVEVRLLLEPGIAEMAAIHASAEDVHRLKKFCDRVEEKIKSGEDYIADDIEFHTCIARCTGNTVMEQLIPIIDTAVMMFVNVTHKKLTEETVRTHRMIANAIADGDFVGARTAMTMHLTYNREKIKRMMDERRDNQTG